MKPTQTKIAFAGLLTLLVLVIWKLTSGSSKVNAEEVNRPNQTGKHQPAVIENKNLKSERSSGKERLAKWKSLYNSPINFWGKVIDQNGEPISGAIVKVYIYSDWRWNVNSSSSSNGKFSIKTDEQGLFEVLNEKGSSIGLSVTAEGYAPMYGEKTGSDLSGANLTYNREFGGMKGGTVGNPFSSKQGSPAVFTLRKKNTDAKLQYYGKTRVPLSKNGTPLIIDLANQGKTSPYRIEIKCWSSAPTPFAYNDPSPYDWRAEIRIIDGKLRKLTERNPFEAPDEDYLDVYKINMPANKENWSGSFTGRLSNFWVKLNNGHYAKMNLDIETRGDTDVDIKCIYNADGTRDLDFDLGNPTRVLEELNAGKNKQR